MKCFRRSWEAVLLGGILYGDILVLKFGSLLVLYAVNSIGMIKLKLRLPGSVLGCWAGVVAVFLCLLECIEIMQLMVLLVDSVDSDELQWPESFGLLSS